MCIRWWFYWGGRREFVKVESVENRVVHLTVKRINDWDSSLFSRFPCRFLFLVFSTRCSRAVIHVLYIILVVDVSLYTFYFSFPIMLFILYEIHYNHLATSNDTLTRVRTHTHAHTLHDVKYTQCYRFYLTTIPRPIHGMYFTFCVRCTSVIINVKLKCISKKSTKHNFA